MKIQRSISMPKSIILTNRWKQYNKQTGIVQMENILSEFKTVIEGFVVRKDQREKDCKLADWKYIMAEGKANKNKETM
jgi:hypothetical protein